MIRTAASHVLFAAAVVLLAWTAAQAARRSQVAQGSAHALPLPECEQERDAAPTRVVAVHLKRMAHHLLGFHGVAWLLNRSG
jgi:hypothetical protein